MTVTVRRAVTEEVLDLRLGVLRPTVPRVPNPRDHDPETVHVAAFEDGVAVGTVTVQPEPYDGDERSWRMRGMAVLPDHQGRGIGRAVLEEATRVAASAGASKLWANGRVSALEFYRRLGWVATGPVFNHGPDDLPHRVVIRRLAPGDVGGPP
ncbi:MAG TPA: GNAT family N-acetyltransferase [Mycobacteriales bacterium]|nr:GNAT family N-acetyltransferase [Mycobacteriales bacterium]